MKRALLALAVATLFTGCSWAFSRPPRQNLQTGTVDCSESRLAPGWDAYQAVGNGLVGMMGLAYAGDSMNDNDGGLFALIGVTGLALAVAHGVSASYGFRNARECRNLRLRERFPYRPGPPIYTPLPAGPPGAAPGDQIDVNVDVDGNTDVDYDTEAPPREIEHIDEVEEVRTTTRKRTIVRP